MIRSVYGNFYKNNSNYPYKESKKMWVGHNDYCQRRDVLELFSLGYIGCTAIFLICILICMLVTR